MRLLLTTDAVGGVWRYSVDLALGMAALGVEPVLAVLGPAPSQDQVAEAAGVRLVATGLPLDWTAAGSGELAQASEKLAALAALLGVDGIHLHSPALVGTARWPAPVVAVAHSCVGTWWRAVRGGRPPDDFGWRIAATEAGLRRASAVIAPSAAHAAAMRAVYGPVGIHVVHNGAAPPASGGVRARAVLTAGRLWDEGKGLAALDRAAARLDAPVRSAGPRQGPNGAAATLPHIEDLGTLDKPGMVRAYAAAQVYCSMAAYEPFGLSVLEAAGAGMRLVLSDIPTFRELWDGVAVFVSEEGLVEALGKALDAAADGEVQVRAGRYTLEKMIDGTLAVHSGACG